MGEFLARWRRACAACALLNNPHDRAQGHGRFVGEAPNLVEGDLIKVAVAAQRER
jgi:hypothetical protein